MQIDRVAFGSLVIDGRLYHSDLVIYPDGRVMEGWRRERGHRLSMEDMEELVGTRPEIIVAGTGMQGLVKPEPDLEERLEAKGIRLLAASNERARELFNELPPNKRVGACFHLTC